jgi:hypothetical protein
MISSVALTFLLSIPESFNNSNWSIVLMCRCGAGNAQVQWLASPRRSWSKQRAVTGRETGDKADSFFFKIGAKQKPYPAKIPAWCRPEDASGGGRRPQIGDAPFRGGVASAALPIRDRMGGGATKHRSSAIPRNWNQGLSIGLGGGATKQRSSGIPRNRNQGLFDSVEN